jgi:hypothetical protein
VNTQKKLELDVGIDYISAGRRVRIT